MLAVASPFASVALPSPPASAAPAAISRSELARLETRVRVLTATAETARNAVLDAADAAVQLRLDLDRLASRRDTEQAKVDAAIVELYERSVEQVGTQNIGPSLGDLNPTLAARLPVGVGVGVSQQGSAVDTLDAHAVTLSELADKAQQYQNLLLSKADAVFAAEDEALTLLAAEKEQFGREQVGRAQRAADIARIEAEQQHLREISDQVSTT